MIASRGWAFFCEWLRIASDSTDKQRGGGDLKTEERLEKKAAIGISGGKLVTQLRQRRHVDAGSRMIRVRVCEEFAPDSLFAGYGRPLR